MFPELFEIPGTGFIINTYGVLLAIGFLSGMWLAGRLALADGLPRGEVLDIVLYALIASLVGSRVLLVVVEWESFHRDWRAIFSLDVLRSGGVFYGGLLAAIAASLLLVRWRGLDWWRVADACAPGIALGQFFGRLGCFAAGCCWGRPTNAWCGVRFSERGHELTGVPYGIPLHPTQLYESVATLGLCLALGWLFHRRRFRGQIILAYMFGYAVIRFVIEIWRDDPRGAVGPFSTSQAIALGCAAFAVGAWLVRRRQAAIVTDIVTDASAPAVPSPPPPASPPSSPSLLPPES
ncbi:prolipoprotein diacylglyceryl transferase [Chloracidobacterium aggregatum]|uniref:prolipoprotein diacylglyceryl transferase n=1 Tax=Chloracidobacterium aggregatum TaxID=2851959 RepID=UPI001B8D29EF|nr:prolipoprotein diacylglyceryl transferase [Chloracidobacterium aggregatum]QUV84297.1 prolipoprotein diacylglyceryl transferase [Chloracidobacterium sp. 2]QUV87214.1 prolipoprotein diacylglyceryl transferase [Chloracidobacterium sp. S]QUV90118.1 prolipoprotein diacylglyceryl transferase [Chloracidobacterium sp. A]